VAVNQVASRKELRNFGLLVGGVFSVIGLWPMLVRGQALRGWAAVVGLLLVVGGAFVPRVLSPFYRVWMGIGHVLGWVNTRVLLGILFYGMLTPIGMALRYMGKITMKQALSEAPSYRVNRQRRPPSHMKNQF